VPLDNNASLSDSSDWGAASHKRLTMNAIAQDPAALQQLNELMRLFYQVISFEDGGEPDWKAMQSLFSEHARITRVTPEAIDYMSVGEFRNMAEELIEVGAFTSFHERELARSAHRYGQIMNVTSAYETKISPDAMDFIERGINSLQLLNEGGEWKILSLCWDDHAPFSLSGLEPVKGII
jgi:hypothetical protein